MSGTTITTTITNAVVLASPGYATPLTITNTGAIEPTTLGAIGIYGAAGILGIAFSNAGVIDGGVGTMGAGSAIVGGAGGDAVYLKAGTAENTGTITGGAGGTGGGSSSSPGTGGTGGIGNLLAGASASLDNAGTITGGAGGKGGNASGHLAGGGNGGTGGVGVDLAGGETASNSGLIIGGAGGTGGIASHGYNDFATGGLGGNGGAGAQVAGGMFTNSSTIIGGAGGLGGAGNYSTVGAPGTGGTGLSVTSGATVVNNGTIIGGTGGSDKDAGEPGGAGVYLNGGTLINDGTIIGGPAGTRTSNNAVSSTGLGVTLGPQAGVLVIEPGSTIVGQVLGNSTNDTLVLGPAPGSAVSTLHGFNEFFSGIYGSKYLDGINNLSFATGADWLVSGNFAETPFQNASLGSSGEPLDIKSITGFAVGDTLAVYAASSYPVTGYSFVTGVGLEVGHVTNRGVSFTSTYAIQGNFVTSDFQVSEPRLLAASGVEYDSVEITLVACFAAGTRIATAAGETKVEDLAIGDLVFTASGTARFVNWIGHRAYAPEFIRVHRAIWPVRIAAGALAEGLPARDLFVSPCHALFFDGALIPAGCLINGANIAQMEPRDTLEYFHIELDAHDIILAEGVPAESYLDEQNRGVFHNAAGYVPQAAPYAACAPRLESGDAVDRVRAGIIQRAGLAQAELGVELTTTGLTRLVLPAGCTLLRLHSAHGYAAGDSRPLGAFITRITVDGKALDLADPALLRGFHAREPGGRWTNGDALLALPQSAQPRIIRIATTSLMRKAA